MAQLVVPGRDEKRITFKRLERRKLLSGRGSANLFLQPIELAGAIDGAVGRHDLDIPPPTKNLFAVFLHRGGTRLLFEISFPRRILRRNQKAHMIGSWRDAVSILARSAAA